MSTPKYLIAKFIPDLARMEPRNIGVIVWSGGRMAARFAAEKAAVPGEVDGRRVPSVIKSVSAYKQWIRYWRREMERPEIQPIRGGNPVRRESAEFLDVLKGTGAGHFVLVDGGMLLDTVADDELPKVADFLFDTLVEEPGSDDSRDPTLDERCDEVVKKSGLNDNAYFRTDYTLPLPFDGVQEELHWSYGFGNGRPLALYQRVSMAGRGENLQNQVNAAAWKLSRVRQSKIVQPERCAAIVLLTDEDRKVPEIRNAERKLGKLGRVLNIADEGTLLSEFQSLPALLVPHHAN